MPYQKNSHCSWCGHPFEVDQSWPRHCANCSNTSFINPLPVAVVLVPVADTLITIRRGIEPGKGKLALPGGYIDVGESWQTAGAREVFEETGLKIDSTDIREFKVHSAPDGTVLIFGLARPIAKTVLPPFVPTAETSEMVLINQPQPLAFPLHTEVVSHYFSQRS